MHPIRKQLGGVTNDKDALYLVRSQDGTLVGAFSSYNFEVMGITASLSCLSEPLCRLGHMVQKCEAMGLSVEPCSDREAHLSDAVPAGVAPRTPEAQIRYWKGVASKLRWENQELEAQLANARKKALLRGSPTDGQRSWSSIQDGRR